MDSVLIRKDLYSAMLQAMRRSYATFKNPEFHSTAGALRELEAILNKVDKLSYGEKPAQTSDSSRDIGLPNVRKASGRAASAVPAVRTGPPPGSEDPGD